MFEELIIRLMIVLPFLAIVVITVFKLSEWIATKIIGDDSNE